MAKLDPAVIAHLEWLGFVRPTGLVVSAPALVRAGAILERHDAEGQRLLRARVEERVFDPKEGPAPHLPQFRGFAESVLGWSFSPKGYAGVAECPIPGELEVPLQDYGETLRPDFAVRELEPKEGTPPWQLLVRVLDAGDDLDHVRREGGRLEASAHGRMERLLRQTGVPAGLLFNGRLLRLLSAPRGESSGWLDFRVADMAQTAGRPICSAMRLLLSEQRLLALPRPQRLAALLADSRKFQNEVSEKLAEQVLHALYELLRGFQAAHDASKGSLLRQVLAEHPDQVYRALLTVILRLVFLLYAEERDMLPEEETFVRYYSLAGLHERLREDAALYPDTMDQRYGAWAQLVTLFRMVNDGVQAEGVRLPPRHGVLFDPDRFPFLEGRAAAGARQTDERIEPPLVSDGTVYRALEKLLVLDGERISYRALDVEQIGSVYETMMGFRLETATGRSVAIRSQKKQGAPTAVDLEALLGEPGANRAKSIQDRADRKLTDTVRKTVSQAATLEDLHAALLPVIDQAATPDLVPAGAMLLQPSEERRRSGSHYTPRELTEPIVSTTLDPIFARLRGADGKPPRPEAILDLKVCDPAMGSGAFLVEACRYLGDALLESWRDLGGRPDIPPDEDEVVFARRLVAQRCLYGVDRNPVAVDLAKMSLWLVTLAKDHALTFVDHALRHGDSLVGLSRQQIENFHWDTSIGYDSPFRAGMRAKVAQVSALRQKIREADESVSDRQRRDLWNQAQFELREVRLLADLPVAAFFEGETPKGREMKRAEFVRAAVAGEANKYRSWLKERRHADPPLAPFHWEIEFPEVFDRENPGLDAVVGNPPFMGGVRISGALSRRYLDYLFLQPGVGGQADLVAYFLRRAYELLRRAGCAGLIATNTVSQGDTRRAGLGWLCSQGATIFAAERRRAWPGLAGVVVSTLFITKSQEQCVPRLDGKPVDRITAFLFHKGTSAEPVRLAANAQKSFKGFEPYGEGFLFEDGNDKATPTEVMFRLCREDPKNADVVLPYVNGDDLATSPNQSSRRWAIFFGDRTLDEAAGWPGLLAILREKVMPYRLTRAKDVASHPWWQFWRTRPELRAAVSDLHSVLVAPETSNHLPIAVLPVGPLFNKNLVIFTLATPGYAVLQSRVHQVWVRLTSSSLKDDQAYRPTDCFETFPFPLGWQTDDRLAATGRDYHEFRAALMARTEEGLTKIYNRFHSPDESDPEIAKLRVLHSAMDRAVLDAYGWTDVPTDCAFLLDYEIDEEEWGDKKKPHRYRWPDEVRDEVLARLLELNAERAKEEARSGVAAAGGRGKKMLARRTSKAGANKDLLS